jgi:hypothetical protein
MTGEKSSPDRPVSRRATLVADLKRHRNENRLVVFLALAVLVVWSAVSVLRQRAEERWTRRRSPAAFSCSSSPT